MHVRISTVQGDPSKIDDGVAAINDKVLPTLKGIEGFRAANFMVDRGSGKLVGVAFWDSEEALNASASAVESIRNSVAEAVGGKVASVEEYEMVAQSW
jgi:hypothetical protein